MSPAGARVVAALALAAAGGAAGALLARPARRMAGAAIPRSGMALAAAAACGTAALLSPQEGAALGPMLVDAALALVLAWLAAVDLASMRLPDVLTLPLAAAGLVLAWLSGHDPAGRAIAAAGAFLVLAALGRGFRRATGRSGLGLGDAKLFAAGGAWVGWEVLPQTLLIACGLGLAAVAVRVAREGLGALRAPLPFGPALCLAILAARLLLTPF